MSLVLADGFEMTSDLGLNKWDISFNGGTVTVVSDVKRLGGSARSVYLTHTSSAAGYYAKIKKAFPGCPQVIVGFGIRFATTTFAIAPTNPVFRIGKADGLFITLHLDSAGRLIVKRSDGMVIGQSIIALAPNTFYYVQMKIVPGVNDGQLEFRIGNDLQFETSALAFSIDVFNEIDFWVHFGSAVTLTMWVDDLYILDPSAPPLDDFLGPCSLIRIAPDADEVNDFENVGAASGFGAVNEFPISTANYVQGDAVGKKVLFGMAPLVTDRPIVAVNLFGVTGRADGGSGISKYKPVFRDAALNEYKGAEIDIESAIWKGNSSLFLQNPLKNAPWTVEDINAMAMGIEVTQTE